MKTKSFAFTYLTIFAIMFLPNVLIFGQSVVVSLVVSLIFALFTAVMLFKPQNSNHGG